MSRVSVRFEPEPMVNQGTVMPPARQLLAYTSSIAGALTVVVYEDGDPFPKGLRLTRDQAATLRDAITIHLGEVTS